MNSQFNELKTNSNALWFIFRHDSILLNLTLSAISENFDTQHCQSHLLSHHYLGVYAGRPCYALEMHPEFNPPQDMYFLPLKQAFEHWQNKEWQHLASRAKQLLEWEKRTQFCGQCGEKTITNTFEKSKYCPSCKATFFPQIAPVALVLIYRQPQQILLARSPHFAPHIYSALAGFVEAGETVEQTIQREVMEEVGLTVKNIQYFGSQPWPFPSNLMLGFLAEYDKGDICINPAEIEDAQWFDIQYLPQLPAKMSLSWQLIHQGIAIFKKNF